MRKEYTTKEFFELIKQKGIAIKSMTDHIPYDYTGDHISFLSKIIPYFKIQDIIFNWITISHHIH